MRIFLTAILAVALLGAAHAAEATIPSRLIKAKAGEWVLMKNVSGSRAGETVKISVDEVKGEGDDAVVVLKIEPENGEPRTIEIPVARHKARRADLEEKAKQISRERLSVKGTEITTWAVSWDDDDKEREFKLWLSDELPIGIVKSWSSDPDVPSAEVIDFGF